jgi:fatty acid desaturase
MSRPPAVRSDFANLSHHIAAAGLMKRRPGYYLTRIGLVAGLYVAGWVTFVVVGDSWYQLLVAPLLAIAFAQLALVAHDIAHRQVFRTRRLSEIAGLMAGNLGIGMSYGWWMDKHTRHHANPNHEERDPDVVRTCWSGPPVRPRRAEAWRGCWEGGRHICSFRCSRWRDSVCT